MLLAPALCFKSTCCAKPRSTREERDAFGLPHYGAMHFYRYRCAVADRHLLGQRCPPADWEQRARVGRDRPRRERVQLDVSHIQHYRFDISGPAGRISDNLCRSGRKARDRIQAVAATVLENANSRSPDGYTVSINDLVFKVMALTREGTIRSKRPLICSSPIRITLRGTVEEMLNALLESEADRLCNAQRHERTEARRDTRAGHYERNLETKAGEVTLKVPKLRRQTFETAIIERYRRREASVEEALIEMYLAGVSVRRVETLRKRCGARACRRRRSLTLNKKIYATIETWRNRPIAGERPHLYLEVLKRTWAGGVRNVSLLVA